MLAFLKALFARFDAKKKEQSREAKRVTDFEIWWKNFLANFLSKPDDVVDVEAWVWGGGLRRGYLQTDEPTPEEIRPNGPCKICKGKRKHYWCNKCEQKRFKQEARKWSSGDKDIDGFIHETQTSATSYVRYLEWIPYSRLQNIQPLAEGGFSTTSTAIWVDGPMWSWNKRTKQRVRSGARRVVLKEMNGQKLSKEFLSVFQGYFKCANWSENIVHYFGLTRNPKTKNITIVMEYAENGNLTDYLRFGTAGMKKRLKVLRQIAWSLFVMHRRDVVHTNFHNGNILIFQHKSNDNIVYAAASDIGLCQPADFSESSGLTFGVLPYVPPEVIRGESWSKAADVYAFGYIMWVMYTGRPPFADVPHGLSLANAICEGMRPPIIEGMHPEYVELMKRCWDDDPNKRPSADDVDQGIGKVQDLWRGSSALQVPKVAPEACATAPIAPFDGDTMEGKADFVSRVLNLEGLDKHITASDSECKESADEDQPEEVIE